MKNFSFIKLQIIMSVYMCFILSSHIANGQAYYTYKDDDIFIEYETSRGIIDNLFVKGSYLASDTMLFLLGSSPGAGDLFFRSDKLALGGYQGHTFTDRYGMLGYIGGENINWQYLTIIMKRDGQVLFNRSIPYLILSLSENLIAKNEEYVIDEYSFLTNISNTPLNIVGYSLSGDIILKNQKLESHNGIKLCDKCIIILSSQDGFVKKMKLF